MNHWFLEKIEFLNSLRSSKIQMFKLKQSLNNCIYDSNTQTALKYFNNALYLTLNSYLVLFPFINFFIAIIQNLSFQVENVESIVINVWACINSCMTIGLISMISFWIYFKFAGIQYYKIQLYFSKLTILYVPIVCIILWQVVGFIVLGTYSDHMSINLSLYILCTILSTVGLLLSLMFMLKFSETNQTDFYSLA